MKKLLIALLLSSSAYAAYEDHFPVYFEYCTGTQWKLQSGEVGGSPGHGFTYINGLCKDYTSEYPQVIPCNDVSPKVMAKYPHDGVGISLDKNFSNVMWVAVPGRSLMMFGDKERKSISLADVKEQVEKINELKVFNEVISKSDKLKPLTPGSQEYLDTLARDTLGTDHAVNWARELHCVKIPAHKDLLPAVTKFLNDSNNQYKSGPGYEWSKLSNNCVHISINQSHALGLTKSIKTDQKYIKMLTNMALPANAFLMYADKAVLAKMPSNKLLKKVLPERKVYPAQVGSIMEVHPAYPTGDYFKTDELGVLTAPRFSHPFSLLATPRKYEKKYMTPENSELKANAEMWIKRYELLLRKMKESERGTNEAYLLRQLDLAKTIFNAE